MCFFPDANEDSHLTLSFMIVALPISMHMWNGLELTTMLQMQNADATLYQRLRNSSEYSWHRSEQLDRISLYPRTRGEGIPIHVVRMRMGKDSPVQVPEPPLEDVTPVTTNRIQDRSLHPCAWFHSPHIHYRSPSSLVRHYYTTPTSYCTTSHPHNPT